MLLTLRYVFSILVLLFAGYGLITQNNKYQSFMMLFLSLFMLVMGLEEFRKDKKALGWFLIAVFLFGLYVSIEAMLIN